MSLNWPSTTACPLNSGAGCITWAARSLDPTSAKMIRFFWVVRIHFLWHGKCVKLKRVLFVQRTCTEGSVHVTRVKNLSTSSQLQWKRTPRALQTKSCHFSTAIGYRYYFWGCNVISWGDLRTRCWNHLFSRCKEHERSSPGFHPLSECSWVFERIWSLRQ